MIRPARMWTLGGLGLLLIVATCYDLAAEAVDVDDDRNHQLQVDGDNSYKREIRGILLRSWRNLQSNGKEQPLSAGAKVPLTKYWPSKNEPDPLLLSGLPITMKIALLQRLTGYDKRALNSKAFLGMRGKKDGGDIIIDDGSWEMEDVGDRIKKPFGMDRFVGTRGKKDSFASRFYGVRGKKIPDKFLGMRGKKADGQASEYPGDHLKRSSSIYNSFVGMRGKKSSDSDADGQEQDSIDWSTSSEMNSALEEHGRLANDQSRQVASMEPIDEHHD